jgi:hypothetical protein
MVFLLPAPAPSCRQEKGSHDEIERSEMEVGSRIGIILRKKNNLAPPEAPINNSEKGRIHKDSVVPVFCSPSLNPHAKYEYCQAVVGQGDEEMKVAKGINFPSIV